MEREVAALEEWFADSDTVEAFADLDCSEPPCVLAIEFEAASEADARAWGRELSLRVGEMLGGIYGTQHSNSSDTAGLRVYWPISVRPEQDALLSASLSASGGQRAGERTLEYQGLSPEAETDHGGTGVVRRLSPGGD